MEKITLAIIKSKNGEKKLSHLMPSFDHMAISNYRRKLLEDPDCVENGNIYTFPESVVKIEEREYDTDSFLKEMNEFILQHYNRIDEVLNVGVAGYYASYGWSESGEAVVSLEIKHALDSKRVGDTGGHIIHVLCNKNTKKITALHDPRLKRNELMVQ